MTKQTKHTPEPKNRSNKIMNNLSRSILPSILAFVVTTLFAVLNYAEAQSNVLLLVILYFAINGWIESILSEKDQ